MDKFTLSNYLNTVEADPKIKNNYKTRYAKVKGKITCKWFEIRNTNTLVLVLKIPSEKNPFMAYDVIMELESASPSDTAKKIKSSEIKVYSNCPSFVFMNARLFEKKGFLVSWAKSLYDEATFAEDDSTQEDEKVNGKKEATDVRYEKSLYYAALYIHDMSDIEILTAASHAIRVSGYAAILLRVKSANRVFKRRTEYAKRHPVSKDKKKSNTKTMTHKVKSVNAVKSIKGSSGTSKVKHI